MTQDAANTTAAQDQEILQDLENVELGKLTTSDFIQKLKSALDTKSPDFTEYFVSLLWVFGTQNIGPDPSRSKLFSALLKDLISNGLIDLNTLKLSLELSTLVDVGVIRDEDAHQKRLIKINTGLVYRQQKYNILREEPEGYSKLVALFSKLPRKTTNLDILIGNVQAIIGQFDLDPNRVMDILLDCLEEEPDNVLYLEILKVFRVPNIVHILGFKFMKYHGAGNGETTSNDSESPVTPHSLYLLAAALIVGGLVNLQELLPYLSPSIEMSLDLLKLAEEKFKKVIQSSVPPKDFEGVRFIQKELKARSGSTYASTKSSADAIQQDLNIPQVKSASSLAASGALEATKTTGGAASSNSKPPPPSGPPPKGTSKEMAAEVPLETFSFPLFSFAESSSSKNQLLGLISGLLRFRAWTEAKTLLEIFWDHGISKDFLLISCEEIRRSLEQLLSFGVDALFHSLRPSRGALHKTGSGGQSNRSVFSFSSGTTIPLFEEVSSIDEFPIQTEEIVSLLSYHLAEDNEAYVKVCFLLKSFLERNLSALVDSDQAFAKDSSGSDLSPSVRKSVGIALALLHGLSVSGADATYFSNQLWPALKMFPFSTRFAIYDAWKKSSNEAKASPLYGLSLAEKNAFQSCRREMKRLAKETTKIVGKNIAKYVHGNPHGVIVHILNQIEVFDNLIPVVIEALKYSLELSRDVFACNILQHLRKFENDSKLKEAGASTHYAAWFTSISKFIGTFYCRFPSTELRGLFNYLLENLGAGYSADLLIVKDLLGIMGGSDTLTNVSAAQLEGLSGGKTLRGEVMGNSALIKSGLSLSTRKSSVILREELIKSGAALPLLLFIAQLRNNLLFDSEMRHLKLISHLYDTAQDLLIQFTDFLVAEAKSMEYIANMMPPIDDLISEIGLSVPVVFQLTRPLLRAALQAQLSGGNDSEQLPEYLKPWNPFGQNVQQKIRLMLEGVSSSAPSSSSSSSEESATFSHDLFILFWTLSSYDIYVPLDRYQLENKRIKDRFSELDNRKDGQMAINMSSAEYAKWAKTKDAEMKSLMISMTALQDELNAQKRHIECTKEILADRRDRFFRSSAAGDSSETGHEPMDDFLQSLVFRRVMMSPLDSVYCTKFARLLHDLPAQSFSLVDFYQKTFEYLLPLMFSCTECEATFCGYALADCLAVITRWQGSQSLFNLEAVTRKQNIFGQGPSASGKGFAQFLDVCKGWHSLIYQTLLSAIDGKEYLYIRSAFLILSKISNFFPFYKREGTALLKRVELFIQQETREDLQIMARSLLLPLTKTQHSWINDMKDAKDDKPAQKSSAPSQLAKSATLSSFPSEKSLASHAPLARSSSHQSFPEKKEADEPGDSSSSLLKRKGAHSDAAPQPKYPRKDFSAPEEREKSSSAQLERKSSTEQIGKTSTSSSSQLPPPSASSARGRSSARDGGAGKSDGRLSSKLPASERRSRSRDREGSSAYRTGSSAGHREDRDRDRDQRDRDRPEPRDGRSTAPLPPPPSSTSAPKPPPADFASSKRSDDRNSRGSASSAPRPASGYDEKDRGRSSHADTRPPPPPMGLPSSSRGGGSSLPPPGSSSSSRPPLPPNPPADSYRHSSGDYHRDHYDDRNRSNYRPSSSSSSNNNANNQSSSTSGDYYSKKARR